MIRANMLSSASGTMTSVERQNGVVGSLTFTASGDADLLIFMGDFGGLSDNHSVTVNGNTVSADASMSMTARGADITAFHFADIRSGDVINVSASNFSTNYQVQLFKIG